MFVCVVFAPVLGVCLVGLLVWLRFGIFSNLVRLVCFGKVWGVFWLCSGSVPLGVLILTFFFVF